MSIRLTVRDLRADDVAEWKRLYLEYASLYSPRRSIETVASAWDAYMLGEPFAIFKVCEEGGQIAGLANAVLHNDLACGGTACNLQDLYVAQTFRRRGVATEILEWFRDAVVTEGWSQLHWSTAPDNRAARSLYERFAQESEMSVRYAVWNSRPRKGRAS